MTTDELVERAARIIADAALDWTDIESGEHGHSPECANWQPYTHEARSVLALFEQAQAEQTAGVNTTPEGIEVKPGQRWRSLDKRDDGRTVTVESVADGKAHVTNGITRSRLSIRRMRRMSTGWELVR